MSISTIGPEGAACAKGAIKVGRNPRRHRHVNHVEEDECRPDVEDAPPGDGLLDRGARWYLKWDGVTGRASTMTTNPARRIAAFPYLGAVRSAISEPKSAATRRARRSAGNSPGPMSRRSCRAGSLVLRTIKTRP